jgi:hypothetical protein
VIEYRAFSSEAAGLQVDSCKSGSALGRCSLIRFIRCETKRGRARFLTLVFGAGRIQWEERPMAIVRNIEVIAQSPNGFDDACREAIREASKTLRGISSFWIKCPFAKG